ncbi:DUF6255 family natural product biosynthesis protein [Streptomyces sp. NPDC052396]|uniref:DUF6255 family natural product biosynthesis protein n=1 Tax=Streptomyces sp. NPDC052396 TaxID=3365689 RepID=UPI0037CDD946
MTVISSANRLADDSNCRHTDMACTAADGMTPCTGCGMRRAVGCQAVALALEIPERTHPHGPTSVSFGVMRLSNGTDNRRSELSRKVREANLQSARGRP